MEMHRLVRSAMLLLLAAGALHAAEPPRVALSADRRAFEVQDVDGADASISVFVADGGADPDRPPVAGKSSRQDGVLRFEPDFPPAAGTSYRVVISRSGRPIQEATIAVPRPRSEPGRVVQVYPTAAVLPENQLKFYVHFSRPMSRGEAYQRIRVLDGQGQPIAGAFLELGEELWDPSGQRFTLFIDPGRIKRGLKPREEFGPVFEEGKSYVLTIDASWPDASGIPLRESFRKEFQVGAPWEKALDPADWNLRPPAAGTREPLEVVLPFAHDHALLERVLWVADAKGDKVPGAIEVLDGETRWRFTPESAWEGGRYRLMAGHALEDLAGNKIGQPFEADMVSPTTRRKQERTAELPFEAR